MCRAAGGELEQIQLLLGHASVQTTERYLGTKQDLVHAPNDGIKLRVAVQRGADMADLSGGSNGILCRDYKGTQAARLVTRTSTPEWARWSPSWRPRAAGRRGTGPVCRSRCSCKARAELQIEQRVESLGQRPSGL
jgi:hypothetical protein